MRGRLSSGTTARLTGLPGSLPAAAKLAATTLLASGVCWYRTRRPERHDVNQAAAPEYLQMRADGRRALAERDLPVLEQCVSEAPAAAAVGDQQLRGLWQVTAAPHGLQLRAQLVRRAVGHALQLLFDGRCDIRGSISCRSGDLAGRPGASTLSDPAAGGLVHRRCRCPSGGTDAGLSLTVT
jgi:hypothetical protein